jgi:ubiquinone/menaquinone biosynthesis C-methylase UbiE
MKTRETLIASYNQLAEEYAKQYCDELNKKPFDRHLLERFVADIPMGKPVCDMGCGSGHVADHLRSLGVEVLGVDLSPGMVEVAKKRYPANEYRVGDMLELDLPDESLGGIVTFYSIIHLKRDQVRRAVKEMFRLLFPGGSLLVSFHQGEGVLHSEESLGQPVAFDCNLYEPDEVRRPMEETGFEVEMVAVRTPYDFEFATTRVYVWGKKQQGMAESKE